MYIVYPKIMGQIDNQTVKKYSIASTVLMENAGIAVSNHIIDNYTGSTIIALCGPGNNGGDCFVAARHLANKHYKVKIALFSSKGNFKGDAKLNMDIARKMHIPMFNAFNSKTLSDELKDTEIIIDGIFGTGFHGPIKSEFIKPMDMINNSGRIIVSIDIPSGINGLTGQTDPHAIHAKSTVSFAAVKTGVLWNEAMLHTGNLFVADISIPDELMASNQHFYMLDRDTVKTIYNLLPVKTKPYAHKMQKGKVLVVGGSRGMQGAPQMSAISALKAGAGISYVHLIEKGGRKFYPETVFTDSYSKLIDKHMPVIVGPGMGTDSRAKDILIEILKKSNSIIIDADAINILSTMPKKIVKSLIAGRMMTPHPEEFRRISGCTFSNIQEKIETAERFARRYNVLLVLKSPPTIITDGKTTFIFPFMSEKMATAGSGDVLCGIIGGLLASGIDMFYSALIGVYLHFVAGTRIHSYSISADDIIMNIGNTAEELFH